MSLRNLFCSLSMVFSAFGCMDDEATPSLTNQQHAIGGAPEKVRSSAVPSVVAIVRLKQPALCTGTLIHKRAVLTAMHCIPSSEEIAVAVVGNLSDPQDLMFIEDHHFAWVDADLAVLALAQAAPVDEFPPLLSSDALTLWERLHTESPDGMRATMVGYGQSGPQCQGKPGDQRMGETRVHAIGTSLVWTSQDTNLVTTCAGDSGSPIFFEGSLLGVHSGLVKHKQTGIYYGCAGRVDRYAEEILQVVQAMERRVGNSAVVL